MPDSVLGAARKRRQQEELAQNVFFELLLYILFVLCTFSVSYGNRDQRTYMVNTNLDSLFYGLDGDAPVPFQSVRAGWMKAISSR